MFILYFSCGAAVAVGNSPSFNYFQITASNYVMKSNLLITGRGRRKGSEGFPSCDSIRMEAGSGQAGLSGPDNSDTINHLLSLIFVPSTLRQTDFSFPAQAPGQAPSGRSIGFWIAHPPGFYISAIMLCE